MKFTFPRAARIGEFLQRSGESHAAPKITPLQVLCLTLAILALGELAAQLRSQWRFGRSVFTAVAGESRFVVDPATNLKLFRSNSRFEGREQSIEANQFGFRSDALTLHPAPHSLRIAVLGASTVMGQYSPSNSLTIPGRIQKILRDAQPGYGIEVINAGIPGTQLTDQIRMLDLHLSRLSPQVVILYSGSPQLASFCQGKSGRTAERHPLWDPSLKGWSVSAEILRKNTIGLRQIFEGQPVRMAVDQVDLSNWRSQLETIVTVAKKHHIQLAMATNARSYRRDQSREDQVRLAGNALFYAPCLDLEDLHRLHDLHNEELVSVAQAHGLPVIRLDQLIPGGSHYFVDSSHFTQEGDRIAAEHLADFISRSALLP